MNKKESSHKIYLAIFLSLKKTSGVVDFSSGCEAGVRLDETTPHFI